ncbi:DinB family protein [Nonomuraea africana]|uniref:Damage-inducible protein DinB n=1 Tax=Nonomuraea africana TaxID=46171 RepID=A0ABR9KM18_9ACTN|nr:DinB family protein [Nonomuraea africana]MBE1563056.1 putative damage-inducible protein DinB [Nonomuraea africana]
MTDPRVDPPAAGDERELLTTFLDWHRETLAVKCAGLTEEQLRERSVPPSTMSLLGLVRHMTDVERYWFRRVLEGADLPAVYWSDVDDVEFDVAEVSADEAMAVWRAELDACRKVSENTPVDALAKVDRRGSYHSHRYILIHMIEEYARHNGHADLLRERLDGATGE